MRELQVALVGVQHFPRRSEPHKAWERVQDDRATWPAQVTSHEAKRRGIGEL